MSDEKLSQPDIVILFQELFKNNETPCILSQRMLLKINKFVFKQQKLLGHLKNYDMYRST